MSKFDYESRSTVKAAQWTENNLDDMKELLKPVVGSNVWDGVEVYVDEIEPYFLRSSKYQPGYKMLNFYADDDMEVDPGQWVVIHEDGEVEILDNDEFRKLYLKS